MTKRKMISVREALDLLDADDSWRKYQVHYTPATIEPYSIENFHVDKVSRTRIDGIIDQGMNRDTGYGDFTRLVETVPGAGRDGRALRRVWMSDTRAEIMEHKPILDKLWWCEPMPEGSLSLLINGLGLGVVVKAALSYEAVGRVDVVERDQRIADLVQPFLRDERLNIHVADAFDVTWPRGTKWDFAWHDIWPTISDDNLPQMDALRRKYRHRVAWQGCWQRRGSLKMARNIRRAKAGTLSFEEALNMLIGRMEL